jgi:hypothetical protein
MYRIPMLMSLMTNGFTETPAISMVWSGPKGITANPIKAGTNAKIGAMLNRNLLAPAGMMSSLKKSLMASAIGWRIPYGPTSMGPMRSCIHPSTFLSARVRISTVTMTMAMTAAIWVRDTARRNPSSVTIRLLD